MPIPVAPLIKIPPEVYPLLERLSKSGKVENRLVRRVVYILRMGEKMPNTQIAKELQVQTKTVKKWRARWLKGAERLARIAGGEQPEKEKNKALELEVRQILSDQALRRRGDEIYGGAILSDLASGIGIAAGLRATEQ